MGENQEKKYLNVSILRVVGDFFPVKGGSITHIIELIHKIDPYIKKQMVICPSYIQFTYEEFDRDFLIQIKRIKNKIIKNDKYLNFFGVSTLNLIYYSYNASKTIIKLRKKNINFPLIIHIHLFDLGILINFFLKIRRHQIPIVIMSHGTIFLKDWGFPSIKETIFTVFFRIPLLNFFKLDHIVLLDDGVWTDTYLSLIKKSNTPLTIVYHAIDTDFFSPFSEIQNTNEFVILSPHRLEIIKRVDLTVLAFREFLHIINFPRNIKLKIAGSGPELLKLKKLVEELEIMDNVIFLGDLKIVDLRNEILLADVIVGTSIVSNINRAIQEAMACAKPVVVFTKKNNFFKHGENCFISQIGNVEDFAQNLNILYKSIEIRERIGKNARNTIIQTRSWEKRLKQELKVYSNIIYGEVKK